MLIYTKNRFLLSWLYKISVKRSFSVATFDVTKADYNNKNYEVSDKGTEQILLKDFRLYKNFITSDEESSLLTELEPHLKRLRYEKSHWDDAIHNYREIEKVTWTQLNKSIIERMHRAAFGTVEEQKTAKILRQTHILDLAESGYIKPHVDSVKFCGGIVGGLSLLSDCVMRFVNEKDQLVWANVLVPRLSFYVMSADIRYLFTHEVLASELSSIRGCAVKKTRRISVMCRNEPAPVVQSSMKPNTLLWKELTDEKISELSAEPLQLFRDSPLIWNLNIVPGKRKPS